MDNGMESMLDTYLFETNSLLDRLDEMLVADEKLGDLSVDDVNEIFRIMHTIKGSSAMMEFGSLASISHHIEDLFFYIRENGIDTMDPAHKKELFNLMFRSEDYLRGQVEKVENGEPVDTDMDSFAAEINGYLKKISGAGEGPAAAPPAPAKEDTGKPAEPAAPSALPSSLPDDEKAVSFLHVFLEEGVGMENLRAFMIVNALKECGLELRYYPENMEMNSETCSTIIEDGFYIAFEDMESANKASDVLQTQNHIHSYELVDVAALKAQAQAEAQAAEEASAAPKQAQETAPASSPEKPAQKPAAAPPKQAPNAPVKQNLISVNLMKLNSLMDIVGEIVITESMVTSSPELNQLHRDAYDNFMKSARQLRKLTDDLQDIAMSLRMVPISGVFQKMTRIVRDMKQKLGKDVRLTLVGEDTEVDKTIVDSIQDPIMHMVRNAVDHGIEENVQDRLDAGKDPQGEVILSASHTSSEVIISITDDGAGMDPDKLLAKARDKGILTKPESEYTKKEALGLVMLPGFSTNQAVTEFSGRGVGMDVVKKNVEAVGGVVALTSELGQGTTFTMKIPLTLAIMDGMKVTVGDSIFTIPIANIRQSFKVTADEIIRDENGNEMVERMDSFYPVIRLHQFYNIETQITDPADGILMWVEASDRSFCLFVDELIGEQQVVVKPLPAFLNCFELKNYGITGCTILGDGNISIILDILSLHAAALENV
ncbi:MAG: chemotaxis protein CheA [Lachnospiraceae bacterium]|nr:chemotaxis protein CheA [Lachnospiraceae bacterium]